MGTPVEWVPRNGSLELSSPKGDSVALGLHLAMIVAAVVITATWVLATRSGTFATERERDRIGVEGAYTALLLSLVLSPALSPQYLIWPIGISAVAVSGEHSQMRRPVALMLGAAALATPLLSTFGGLVSNGADAAYFLVARNRLLVAALVDALVTLAPDVLGLLAVRNPGRAGVETTAPDAVGVSVPATR